MSITKTPKKPSSPRRLPVPVGRIDTRIYAIRGYHVMLSSHLAELYEVPPKALNQAVKRNRDRFPSDFMFQLTRREFENLKSQFVTSSWGGIRRSTPYAFTQEGVAMLSSVLNSSRAVQVNIAIMRAFVQLRQLARTHKELSEKVTAMEKRYDANFRVVFQAIRKLLDPPRVPPRHRMGFAIAAIPPAASAGPKSYAGK
jgi:hypothetical protein